MSDLILIPKQAYDDLTNCIRTLNKLIPTPSNPEDLATYKKAIALMESSINHIEKFHKQPKDETTAQTSSL